MKIIHCSTEYHRLVSITSGKNLLGILTKVCLLIQAQGRCKSYFLYQDKVVLDPVLTYNFWYLKVTKIKLSCPCHNTLFYFISN